MEYMPGFVFKWVGLASQTIPQNGTFSVVVGGVDEKSYFAEETSKLDDREQTQQGGLGHSVRWSTWPTSGCGEGGP